MNILYIILLIFFLLTIARYVHREIRRKSKVVQMNKDQCTGCQRCIKRCRRQVFDTVIDEGKICTVVKHPEKCTACGDCLVVCKRKALSIVKRT